MWIFISIVTIACITCFIIGGIQEKKKKKENPQPEAETDKIKSVTVLGTRTGEQTKILVHTILRFIPFSSNTKAENGKPLNVKPIRRNSKN